MRALRLNQPCWPLIASISLSVGSSGSDSTMYSTSVPPPWASSSVQIAVVLMRLNLPPRPTATIRCGGSTTTNVMSAHEKRWSGASTLKRAPAPWPTDSIRVRRQCFR